MTQRKPADEELIRRAARAFGRLGGLARAKALTSARLAAIAKKGGLARKAALSPERRRAIAKKASAARKAERRQP